jgi:hypothetical protein
MQHGAQGARGDPQAAGCRDLAHRYDAGRRPSSAGSDLLQHRDLGARTREFSCPCRAQDSEHRQQHSDCLVLLLSAVEEANFGAPAVASRFSAELRSRHLRLPRCSCYRCHECVCCGHASHARQSRKPLMCHSCATHVPLIGHPCATHAAVAACAAHARRVTRYRRARRRKARCS